jgi:hypothetical protein
MGTASVKRITFLRWFALFAFFGGAFFSCTQPDNDASPLISAGEKSSTPLKKMPQFEAMDINNQPVSYRHIQGKIALVYFINLKQRDQIDIISDIYGEFGDFGKLSIIVFLEGSVRSSQELLGLGQVRIIPDQNREYGRLFNVPSCCESFYLYNETGNLISSGANRWDNKQVIKVSLKKELENDTFSISRFLSASENIRSLIGPKEANRIFVEDNPHFYIFALIRDFCKSCSSGRIIQKLNEFQKVSKNRLYIILYLPSSFNSQDLVNLRRQLGVDFDIQIAEIELGLKWDELVEEYGPLFVTDILILANQEGYVITSAFPECDCYIDFYRDISEILDSH